MPAITRECLWYNIDEKFRLDHTYTHMCGISQHGNGCIEIEASKLFHLTSIRQTVLNSESLLFTCWAFYRWAYVRKNHESNQRGGIGECTTETFSRRRVLEATWILRSPCLSQYVSLSASAHSATCSTLVLILLNNNTGFVELSSKVSFVNST